MNPRTNEAGSNPNWERRELLADEQGNVITKADADSSEVLAYLRARLGKTAAGQAYKNLIIDAASSDDLYGQMSTVNSGLDGLSYPDHRGGAGYPDGFAGDVQEGAELDVIRGVQVSVTNP